VGQKVQVEVKEIDPRGKLSLGVVEEGETQQGAALTGDAGDDAEA